MKPVKLQVKVRVQQRGRVTLSEVPIEVKEDKGEWRLLKKPMTFQQLINWLIANCYVPDGPPVGPWVWEGTTERIHFYRHVE